ncbi:hypothetical protein ONB66_00425 [Candidatus Vidania fulgoroideae]|uniref:tRNA-specific 2-thiouridylase MnmA n=1 Tax=Candidatus Vidania fulgoroideorum TaxID=881286 RepID=A0AAX3NBL5_9PROT|nr:hypothetical protein ONB67_00465 [Candidatus Vidania fulgoroideae]WDR79478.1 hypothetical protein ONB66_00425 [Candidatus Vidania fulgoroideae]
MGLYDRKIYNCKGMKILILTSGGVDSTYCVIRNSKIGYKNIYCLYIKVWQNNCKYKNDIKILNKIKKIINFKIIILDMEKEYYKNIFLPFIKLYKLGFSPNCDIFCNEKIKFKCIKKIKIKKKINIIFSGHYIKILKNNIFCSLDLKKDQSFFLCRTNLKNIKFPLGFFLKKDIIFLIKFLNIKVAKSSKGICFIEKNIEQILNKEVGKIYAKVKYNNKTIGKTSFFKTTGQKIYLNNNIYYIYNKIRKEKILNVCNNFNSSLLFIKLISISKINFRKNLSKKIINILVKIRNCSNLEKAFIFFYKKKIFINFVNLQRNISLGQIISIYNKKKMLILSGNINLSFGKGFVNF